jgi:GntR family transcriptional regulator
MSSDDLDFNVDQDGPIAVYIQIENQIQFAIASGTLRSGDPLPSVRELSTRLDINPNTVTKSYRDLELLGLLKTRRGIGVKISEGARAVCKKRVHDMVKQHLRDAVGESMASGLTAAQVRKIVAGAVSSGYSPYASGDGK